MVYKLIKKKFDGFITPYNKITDNELLSKIRVINFLTFLTGILNALIFLIRFYHWSNGESSINITTLVVPLILVVVAFSIIGVNKTRFHYFVMHAVPFAALLTPWLGLKIYQTNSAADQILFNATYCSAVVILFAPLYYSNRQIIFYSITAYLNVYLFYGIILQYPITWLYTKYSFLLMLTILSLLWFRLRNESIQNFQESEENFQTVVELLPVGMVIIQNNRLQHVNDAMEQISGHSKSKLQNWSLKDVFNIINPDDLPFVKDKIQKIDTAEINGKISQHTIRIQTKQNGIKWVEVFSTHMLYQGEPASLVALVDFTALKKRELENLKLLKELTWANEELSDYAYVTSHNLKTPLRGIYNLADFLLKDYSEKLDAQGQKYLNLLMNRVKRMNNLVFDIAEYSQIGRIQERVRDINMNQLVANVVQSLDIPTNIKTEIQEELPTLSGERVKLFQLFYHLLDNASKFLDKPQGLIRICCADAGEYWQFSVADNGIGIEERFFEKIFELFQTLTPQSAQEESTGIGLSIVKRVVQLHKGQIWVESEVGKGSTFFFTIPKSIPLEPALNKHQSI